jgi:hypothetical protein
MAKTPQREKRLISSVRIHYHVAETRSPVVAAIAATILAAIRPPGNIFSTAIMNAIPHRHEKIHDAQSCLPAQQRPKIGSDAQSWLRWKHSMKQSGCNL